MKNHPQNDFVNFLAQFDMRPEGSGLLFAYEDCVDYSEKAALEYAKKYHPDAVYFRRFSDNRSSTPQIYIYDLTDTVKDDLAIGELYKKVWNSGQVPLIFIFFKTEVKILNCFKRPEFDPETGDISYTLFEKIQLASKAKKELQKIKDFSARKFDNGTFWSNPKYKSKFSLKETAYLSLLSELKRAKNNIINKDILEEKLAKKLLVMSILVKYLEERKDENENTVFPEGYFSKYSKGRDAFTSVLRKKGACLKLFDNLSGKDRFNGEIFSWKDKKERELLKRANLDAFADFFEGKLEHGQYTFWRLYSFNDLPIELISNIYEEFLESKPGIVYTPPYLVNFLIDELVPLSDYHKTDFKVIDPACGSGIFLVAVYRRMIQWWKIRNNWKKPGAKDLRELKIILKKNIFGVDIHEEAVRLTFFSLSLALLDELSPKVIWENLKFDDLLGKNFIHNDFFKLLNKDYFKQKFDLVIGNPPFESKLKTVDAEEIEKKRILKRPKLPDNQIALLFLDQSVNLCREKASLCLIMPAGPFLYNNNSRDFRKYFLSNYHVPQIIDFTFLSEVLFESAKVATLAVFAKKQNPTQNDLLHVTVRRTKPIKEKLYFELDHYDFHNIPFHEAIDNRLVWKANLLGGGRLRHLLARFEPMRSFGEYLSEMKKNFGWKIAEGFIIGNEQEITELIKLKVNKTKLSQKEKIRIELLEKQYKKADYLTGKKTLPTKAFTEKGIDEDKIYTLKEKYFIRKRKKNKKIFQGPHLLIKEGVTRNSIPVIFRDDDLSFRHEIIGIYAPENQKNELQKIEKRVKNNTIYRFHAAGFSGRYMIGRATAILKKDIESLPFPEGDKELELSGLEQILVGDVLDYMLDFRRKGENADAEKPVTDEQLLLFSKIYCKVLNSVYKKFKPYKPVETDSYICFPFYYKNKPEIDLKGAADVEGALDELIRNNVTENSRIIRMLRVYEENIIYLIKPKQTRYWLQSIAIRDADETFADLVSQGY